MAISTRSIEKVVFGRVCAGRVSVMVKFVISAAPSNSGVTQEILAHVQVLLKCVGSTGGEGMPTRVIVWRRGKREKEKHLNDVVNSC